MGRKRDGRWRNETGRVSSAAVVTVGKGGESAAVDAYARTEERRGGAIQLAGADVARSARVIDGKAALGVLDQELQRAAGDTDARGQKGGQVDGASAGNRVDTA